MINTCELCNTPTLFSKNRYCETCANNLWVGLEMYQSPIVSIEDIIRIKMHSTLGWASYHKDKNLGGEKQHA